MKKVSLLCIAVLAVFLLTTRNITKVKAQTSNPSIVSEVSVAGGSGYGSTGIYARVFTSVILTTGSDITYTSDAVNGDYFTINSNGIYAISFNDGNVHTDGVGISLNLASTSAFTTSWGSGNELCEFEVSNNGGACSSTTLLASGDVLRAHSTNGGTPPNTQTVTRFIVVRVR